jgi:hypothetical protein
MTPARFDPPRIVSEGQASACSLLTGVCHETSQRQSSTAVRNPAKRSLLLRALYFVSLVALSLCCACGKKSRDESPAKPINPHSVALTWNASTSKVVGYYVYRGSPPGGFARMQDGMASTTRYVDRTVEAGRTYSYYVVSVDFRGVESKPSEKITVTVPTTITAPLKQ